MYTLNFHPKVINSLTEKCADPKFVENIEFYLKKFRDIKYHSTDVLYIEQCIYHNKVQKLVKN